MFPFTLNFKVGFKIKGYWPDESVGMGNSSEPDFEWPFHYTVKSGKHYGLLVLGTTRMRGKHHPTPIRKHFKEYAKIIASQVLKYHKEGGHGMHVIVYLEGEDWGMSGRYYHGCQLSRMGPKAYFMLCNEYTNMLYAAVSTAASLYLEKIGYKPVRKPRKRITKNFCRWRNYKGLEFAQISGGYVVIRLDERYESSLLDIGILPEVIKHVNKRGCDILLWHVNTPTQALEAQLLLPDSEVNVRRPRDKEVEVLPF